jgi:hypothetical protein
MQIIPDIQNDLKEEIEDNSLLSSSTEKTS